VSTIDRMKNNEIKNNGNNVGCISHEICN